MLVFISRVIESAKVTRSIEPRLLKSEEIEILGQDFNGYDQSEVYLSTDYC